MQSILLLGLLCGLYMARGFKSPLRRPIAISRDRLWCAEDYRTENMNIAPFDCRAGAESINGPLRIAPLLQPKSEQGEEPAGCDQKSVSFTVYGDPIPLSRHRTVSGGMRTYNPSAADQKKFAKACMTAGVLPSEPLEGPVEAVMTFYFPRPKSHYRTGKFAGQLKGGQDVWHSKKKDLDNLVKFVLDSLNSLAYVDDGQVCAIKAMKLYTEDHSRSEIILRTLPDVSTDSDVTEALMAEPSEPKLSKKLARKQAVKKEAAEAVTDVVVGNLRGYADIYACSS